VSESAANNESPYLQPVFLCEWWNDTVQQQVLHRSLAHYRLICEQLFTREASREHADTGLLSSSGPTANGFPYFPKLFS
jgi:hypothetical protein